jgi:hypothetical protein
LEAIKSEEQFLGPAAIVLNDCVNLAKDFVTVTLQHCLREANKKDDNLNGGLCNIWSYDMVKASISSTFGRKDNCQRLKAQQKPICISQIPKQKFTNNCGFFSSSSPAVVLAVALPISPTA